MVLSLGLPDPPASPGGSVDRGHHRCLAGRRGGVDLDRHHRGRPLWADLPGRATGMEENQRGQPLVPNMNSDGTAFWSGWNKRACFTECLPGVYGKGRGDVEWAEHGEDGDGV